MTQSNDNDSKPSEYYAHSD